MIVKMKFINISGPRNDIDRVTDQYLSRYEIQLESALSELKTVDNLRPFVELNPYREVLSKANEFVGYLPNAETVEPDTKLGLDDMFELVRKADEDYRTLQEKKEKLKQKIEEYRAKQQIVAPFRPLECDLHRVLHYRYITYRFGRIAVEFYHKMQKYLMDDLKAIFVEGERDESYVYGVYFVSQAETQKVDAVFRSLHFERIELKGEFEGTPDTAYRVLENEIARVNLEIEDLDKQAGEMLADRAPQLVAARDRLEELSNNFDVRKLAARMEDKQEDYYILCGWMAEDDVDKFVEEVKEDDKVFVVVEDDHDAYFGEPPTKLENPKLFKPFEMFVSMYGLPAHNEMDPTMFVGLTYSFIFGVMFGDVGQGLLLMIGGGLVYKFKKAPLAGIIATAGVFSTIFGFLFGSIFGFEDVLPAHRHGRLGAAVHLHQDLVLALVGVKPAAGQKCVVHVPCLPPCALLWATASWSQRSFSGWPACPLTQTYVMVCLASCSSACAQRSGFRAGEPSDFFQPRRFQPLAHPFCSPLMTYWLSEQ